MIALTPKAREQVRDLQSYYAGKRRPQAIRNLEQALTEASQIFLERPERGLSAPRPYPALSSFGLRWLKRKRYWIACDPEGPVIVGVYFETNDIPRHFGETGNTE